MIENLDEAKASILEYLAAGDPLPAPPPPYRRWLAEVVLELIEAELKKRKDKNENIHSC